MERPVRGSGVFGREHVRVRMAMVVRAEGSPADGEAARILGEEG